MIAFIEVNRTQIESTHTIARLLFRSTTRSRNLSLNVRTEAFVLFADQW